MIYQEYLRSLQVFAGSVKAKQDKLPESLQASRLRQLGDFGGQPPQGTRRLRQLRRKQRQGAVLLEK